MHGVLGVPAYEKQTVKWGEIEQELDILRVIRKPKKAGNQDWLCAQMECLPTIGRLIREGKIAAYNSFELKHEHMRRAKIGQAVVFAFKGCGFISAQTPVERSRIFQSDFSHSISGQALADYCEWLLESSLDTRESFYSSPVAERFTDFELNNLRNLKLFREICQSLENKHYPDAYHLWTAEVNGLDYFLMNEKKFRNEFEQKSKAQLHCKIISPAELLEIMGVATLDPIPLEYDKYYSLI